MAVQYVVLEGHTYSSGSNDEGIGIRFLDNGGHWDNYIPLVEDILVITGRAASYASAVSNTPIASSSSSLSITNASKTFTVLAGLTNLLPENWIRANLTSDPTKYMYGQITSYVGTSLVVDVQVSGGSGTFSSWNITLAGFRGATGPAGSIDTTTRTGVLVGNGATIVAATAGTDVKTLGGQSILGSGDIAFHTLSEQAFLRG